MNKYIEKFKKNELLDAAWFCSLFGKDVESLSLRDALGPFGDMSPMGQLIFGKYRLLVVYDKTTGGLFDKASSDEEIAQYIQEDLKSAFKDALEEHSPYVYILNVASTENFGAFNWEESKGLLNKQLTTFMPIIKKFMADALTDNLQL